MSAAVRRQSVSEHHGPGGHAPSTAANIGGSSHHHHNRGAYIMTSAHGRRVSVSNPTHSAIGRGYENTYKTEPEKPFSTSSAKRVIRDVMEAMLTDKTYDASSCNQLSKTLADVIKQRVKELGHARYKIVSVVAIGQAQPSSVAFASRCVWNANFDSFAEYTYRNSSLYAIGLVYAVYCD